MNGSLDDPATLTLRDFSDYETDRTDPRAALMWPPTAADVARIAAAVRATGEPRVLDAGAGSGLLARLLADAGLKVRAVDPGARDDDAPVGRFHPVEARRVREVPAPAAARVVSWMEAGADYRRPATEGARLVVQAVDVGGGCGVRGATSLAPFGLRRIAHWLTPSFENVAWARRTRGRGPDGRPLPRKACNRIEIWARDGDLTKRVRARVARAKRPTAYPWEAEMRALELAPTEIQWKKQE